jgi:hypothetical protein
VSICDFAICENLGAPGLAAISLPVAGGDGDVVHVARERRRERHAHA